MARRSGAEASGADELVVRAPKGARESTRSVPLPLFALLHFPSVRFHFKLPRAPRVRLVFVLKIGSDLVK